jgi:hypothetical protein
MIYPGAPLKIVFVERPAPPSPTVAAAAEEAAAASVCEPVGNTDVLPPVEVARRPVGPKAAAFYDAGSDTFLVKLEGKRNPRGAAPDDADSGLDCGVVIEAPGVDKHGRDLDSKTCDSVIMG